jgi:hypothetical protein
MAIMEAVVPILKVVATILPVVQAIVARTEAILQVAAPFLRCPGRKLARPLSDIAGAIAQSRQQSRASTDRTRQFATAQPPCRQLTNARTPAGAWATDSRSARP